MLRPSAASTLNKTPTTTSLRNSLTTVSGVKRTHSGLAKALSGSASFEDAQAKENTAVKCSAPKVTSCEFFDEDDFDDDIDLDIVDPSTKVTVTYPELPGVSKASASSTSFTKASNMLPKSNNAVTPGMFYPTLPKLEAHDTRKTTSPDSVDSGYYSRELAVEEPLKSSAPLPWSSSPPEHREPRLKPASIKNFAYDPNASVPPREKRSATAHPPRPAAKRSKLPWKAEGAQAEEAQAEQNGPPPPQHFISTTASRGRVTDATAAKTVSYPWNTTASAIKEKKDLFKRKPKTNEIDEEALDKANTKKRDSVARLFLSDEQQHVLDLVVQKRKSVFFTGSAGTGKSVLLREIITDLRKLHQKDRESVAVTASTGLAACNIGGVTLHSFAGIGLGKEEVPELVKKIRKNQKAKIRWQKTKVLVIDEISMVDGDLFDKLEGIARQIRGNGRPFGGIRLVITGDFFQLPPVPDYGKVAKFAFDAATWSTSIEYTIGLHHVFRQKDPVFAGMLNEMREGRLTPASIAAFQELHRPMQFEDNIDSTELFPTRREVELANSTKMGQLVGDLMTFEARDGGTIVDKTMRDKLLANCMAPEKISLKKGAQVMLIKNIDETLVNGSLGKVIGFMSEGEFDNYTARESEYTTSQGGTFKDGAERGDRIAQAKNRIMENLLGNTSQRYPVVRFTIPDGTTRDLLCQRETWKIELPNGEVQASRAQIPLILAWALSIHKAQGQTLERVKVDLGKVFEKGQAYVALSRATSMQGLQVLRFDARKVMAHDKVRTFYQNLTKVEQIEKKEPKVISKTVESVRTSGIGAQEYQKRFAAGDV